MGTAAVLTHMGPEGVGAHVGVDGSVFKKHTRFQAVSRAPLSSRLHVKEACAAHCYCLCSGDTRSSSLPIVQWMEEALAELGVVCSLVMAEDGSGFGAAIVAKVAEAVVA